MSARCKPADRVWADFQHDENLSDQQLEQFKQYAMLLLERNEEFNLTAITELTGIVRQHFIDSLALREKVDLASINSIVDIGSGAGFPGIPLKIMFPHLKLMLIEVNKKKQGFLRELATLINLDDVEICGYDWRTFLRTVEVDVDLFVTRASLTMQELCRIFKPGCKYHDKKVVYWATIDWEADKWSKDFVQRSESYKLGRKERKLVFLGREAI